MHWRESGTGDPIIFLHAFPFHSGMWDEQLRALPINWRGIAPDLRGFGRTPGGTAGPYTMESYADDVVALLDHLKLEQAVICGLSMGGYIAMAMYRKYPQRVRAIVLCDTRSTPDSEEAKQGRLQLAAKTRANGIRAVVEAMAPKMISEQSRTTKPELFGIVQQMMSSTQPETAARALEGMAMRPSSEDVLRNMNVSALVVHGEDDAIIPRGEAEMMARGTRGARLQLVPDAGHLVNLEQPEIFNTYIREFLDNLPPNFGNVRFALG